MPNRIRIHALRLGLLAGFWSEIVLGISLATVAGSAAVPEAEGLAEIDAAVADMRAGR